MNNKFMLYLFVLTLSFSISFANSLSPQNCSPDGEQFLIGDSISITFDVCFEFDFQVNAGEWYTEITILRGGTESFYTTIPGFDGNGPNICVPVNGGIFTPDSEGTYTMIIQTHYSEEVNPDDDICSTTFDVVEPGVIKGVKFRDDNGNGIFDTSEVAMRDWIIKLDNGDTTSTDPFGNYSFTLPPGIYNVSEEQDTNYTQTFPVDPNFHTVLLSESEIVDSVNFGNQPDSATIKGKVFLDLNNNRMQDDGELGVSDWDVFLENTIDDNPESITTTDVNGNYSFTVPAFVSFRVLAEFRDQYYQTTDIDDFEKLSPNEVKEWNFGELPIKKPNMVFPVSPIDGETEVQASPPPLIIWDDITPPFIQNIRSIMPDTTILPVTSTTIILEPVQSAAGDSFTETFDGDTNSYTPTADLQYGTEYKWTVEQINEAGTTVSGPFTFTTESVVSVGDDDQIPTEFVMYQNYPNPFNPSTSIKFGLPELKNGEFNSFQVKLVVYDILGREVIVLLNENKSPGYYEVIFDAGNLPSGIYFYKLSYSEFVSTKKLLLIK